MGPCARLVLGPLSLQAGASRRILAIRSGVSCVPASSMLPRTALTGRRIARSAVSLASGEVLARALAFVGTSYLARILGPSAFGVLGFATAICGYLALAVSAGVGDAGARAVARHPESAAALAVGVTAVRIAIAGAALVALVGVTAVVPLPPTTQVVLVLTALTFFSLALDTSWVYKGLEAGHRVGAAAVAAQALYVGLVVLAVRRADDVARVPVAQFVGEAVAALWLLAPLARRVRRRVDLRGGWAVVRGSGSLGLARILRTVIFSFDVVMLGVLSDVRTVGLYTAAYRVCYLVLAVVGAVHMAYLPAITRAAANGHPAVAAVTTRSLVAALTIGTPGVVGGVVLASPILVTLFGPAYAEAAWALRLVLLSIGCICISLAAHNVLVALGRPWIEVRVVGVAAVVNVVLNVALIPRYGVVGAGLATVVAEGGIVAGTAVALGRLGVRPWRVDLARPLVAGVVMGAALVALGPSRPLPLGIGVGASVYALALLALNRGPAARPPFGVGAGGRRSHRLSHRLKPHAPLEPL